MHTEDEGRKMAWMVPLIFCAALLLCGIWFSLALKLSFDIAGHAWWGFPLFIALFIVPIAVVVAVAIYASADSPQLPRRHANGVADPADTDHGQD